MVGCFAVCCARAVSGQLATAPPSSEMTSRLCWKPYFHNPKLSGYLRGVNTPTLIVWGKQDAIIPVNCGELYQQALANATLHVIDRCGHSPALEKPQEFVRTVREFLAQQ